MTDYLNVRLPRDVAEGWAKQKRWWTRWENITADACREALEAERGERDKAGWARYLEWRHGPTPSGSAEPEPVYAEFIPGDSRSAAIRARAEVANVYSVTDHEDFIRADERRVVLGRVVEKLEDAARVKPSSLIADIFNRAIAIVRAEMEGE